MSIYLLIHLFFLILHFNCFSSKFLKYLSIPTKDSNFIRKSLYNSLILSYSSLFYNIVKSNAISNIDIANIGSKVPGLGLGPSDISYPSYFLGFWFMKHKYLEINKSKANNNLLVQPFDWFILNNLDDIIEKNKTIEYYQSFIRNSNNDIVLNRQTSMTNLYSSILDTSSNDGYVITNLQSIWDPLNPNLMSFNFDNGIVSNLDMIII